MSIIFGTLINSQQRQREENDKVIVPDLLHFILNA